mgnify:CR=1 FL=1
MKKDKDLIDPDQDFYHKFFRERETLVESGRTRNRSQKVQKATADGSDSEEDEEAIDFYCSENINDMKAAPVAATSADIDEGFFDKPLPSRQNKMRLSCESPSQLSL